MGVDDITEKEFMKILFDSQKTILSQIKDLKNDYLAYLEMEQEIKDYKFLGYGINFFFDDNKDIMSYKPFEKKMGFLK